MRTIAVSFRVKSIYSQNNITIIIIIGKHYKASAVATTLLLYTVICSIPASEYHGKNRFGGDSPFRWFGKYKSNEREKKILHGKGFSLEFI